MIAVVLHCYTINDWEAKFSRQVNRLKASGLYDGCDEIYIYITDPSNKLFNHIKSILSEFPKIQLDYSTINYGEGYKALCKVDELGKKFDNCKIFYFHTKGVFNRYKNFSTKEINELKIKGVETWVDMMEFFLVDKWEECVNKLDEYDTVGLTCNGEWWWGNFWWTHSRHVKKNIPFSTFYQGSRWSSESWLHESNSEVANIKKYEFNHFEHDPHYSSLPKYFYDGTDLSDLELTILNAEYGYFGEQRDEGRPTPSSGKTVIDVTDIVIGNLRSFNNRSILIEPGSLCNYDIAPGLEKLLRINFKTNKDDEVYTISSFFHNTLNFGYK